MSLSAWSGPEFEGAACREDPDPFEKWFSVWEHVRQAAMLECGRCPVLDTCREVSMEEYWEHGEAHLMGGVFAGTDEKTRKKRWPRPIPARAKRYRAG